MKTSAEYSIQVNVFNNVPIKISNQASVFKHTKQIMFHSWIHVTLCLQHYLFQMFEKLVCLIYRKNIVPTTVTV